MQLHLMHGKGSGRVFENALPVLFLWLDKVFAVRS